MQCYQQLLNILYKDLVTNENLCKKLQAAIGEFDKLLTLVKKQKPKLFGHISRSLWLSKDDSVGHNKRKEKRDGQKNRLEDNIKD